jgi:hypothetical protein
MRGAGCPGLRHAGDSTPCPCILGFSHGQPSRLVAPQRGASRRAGGSLVARVMGLFSVCIKAPLEVCRW